MPEKKCLSILVRSRDVTGRVFIIQFHDLFLRKFKLRKQMQVFQKLLRGNAFLYLLNILATEDPNMRMKNFKNYILILAIVNYRNWPNASST